MKDTAIIIPEFLANIEILLGGKVREIVLDKRAFTALWNSCGLAELVRNNPEIIKGRTEFIYQGVRIAKEPS